MAAPRNTIDRRSLRERRERRVSGQTIPFDFEELERLRTQSAAQRSQRMPTAPIEHEHEVMEITVEGEDPAPRKPARAATVADPMTTSILAEIERLDRESAPEPAPPRRDSNVNIKPRGGR